MPKPYIQVTSETIQALKSNDFTSVWMVPLDRLNKHQATIELIPGKETDIELNVVSLDSKEIHAFIDGHSPMPKYIIDREFLMEVNSG